MSAHPGVSRVTHAQIAQALGVDRSAVTKVLNRDPRHRSAPATRRRILATARRLGYDFSRVHPLHRREYQRVSVDLPARVTIRLRDSRPYAQGQARMYERSQGGALVGAFRLSKMTLPLRPFTIELEFEERPGSTVRLVCRPVRIVMDGTVGLGLQVHRPAA